MTSTREEERESESARETLSPSSRAMIFCRVRSPRCSPSKIMAVCEQREAPEGCRVLAIATMDRTWLVSMREEAWPSWVSAFNTSLTQSNLPVRVEESGRVWTRPEGGGS